MAQIIQSASSVSATEELILSMPRSCWCERQSVLLQGPVVALHSYMQCWCLVDTRFGASAGACQQIIETSSETIAYIFARKSCCYICVTSKQMSELSASQDHSSMTFFLKTRKAAVLKLDRQRKQSRKVRCAAT